MAEADKLLKLVCSDFLLSNNSNDSLKQEALDSIINKLLAKHAIEEVPTEQEVVFNRVFLCEKPHNRPYPNKPTFENETLCDGHTNTHSPGNFAKDVGYQPRLF